MISSKLKQARLLIGVSQKDAASLSGISQRDISQLENGKKEFIPTSYIQYLNSCGVDLNSIFSNAEVILLAAESIERPPGQCVFCELKDETINSQKIAIAALQKVIEKLSARESDESNGQKRKVG